MIEPTLVWKVAELDIFDNPKKFDLYFETEKRVVASVWANGVWHTWDHNGTGGENDREDSVARAKVEAAASAVEQGFI